MAERRVKEISIRKVLGANVISIFLLLSKEFIIMILISMVIAWPISYLLIDEFFLDQFAIQMKFQPWILLGAGVMALMIALLITSYRALMASRANPAVTLKYE